MDRGQRSETQIVRLGLVDLTDPRSDCDSSDCYVSLKAVTHYRNQQIINHQGFNNRKQESLTVD